VRDAEARGIRCWGPVDSNPTHDVTDTLRRDGVAVLLAGDSLAATCSLVRGIFGNDPVGTLAIFGGDTAFGVIEALGIRGLWPLEEICQGVVVSRLERPPAAAFAAGMHLVTKAGGFGPIDVIHRIREALDKGE
jgi:uncharacterized protein YgbK (DUF1537 family)